MLFMENCAEFLEMLFACWSAGLCAVPVNARLHLREAEYILQDFGFSADRCNIAPCRNAGAARSQAPIIATDSSDYARLVAGEPSALLSATPLTAPGCFTPAVRPADQRVRR